MIYIKNTITSEIEQFSSIPSDYYGTEKETFTNENGIICERLKLKGEYVILTENDLEVQKILLEEKKKEQIALLKKEKIQTLNDDYNKSKEIILQNGNTLVIQHDTPEREIFTDNLENLKTIRMKKRSVLSYRQRVGNIYLGFCAFPYIWKRLFLNKFTEQRPSLNLESKRSKNRETYDLKKLKIEVANSIEDLEAITWNFEDITIININVEAQKLLDDPETPAYVIEAIKKLKGEDGQIHLIEDLMKKIG